MWKTLDRSEGPHYTVMKKDPVIDGMAALRGMFPDGEANDLNFVLFSTSGVHGTYNKIEEAEEHLRCEGEETCGEVTFLIVHPRLVALRYGVCSPANQDDIAFLKRLRESSMKAIAGIGAAH